MRRKPKDLFELAGFTFKSYETTALVLATTIALTSDANTKIKCDRALKGLRRLRRLVKQKGQSWQKRKKVKQKRSLKVSPRRRRS